MQAKNYEKAISDAKKKLNDIYYLYGDCNNEAYKMIERGFIMGIATVFGVEPQNVKACIFNDDTSDLADN